MTWNKGFNFRATSAYVSDGLDETYVLLASVYPTFRNGVTFGWTSGPQGAVDRDAGIDPRLAGMNFQGNNGTRSTFRVDLPADGDFEIRLAIGDGFSPQVYQYVQILDDSTPILTIDDTDGTLGAHWDDAAGTDFVAGTWPAGNVPLILTFTSNILKLVIGTPISQTNNTTIAHLSVSQVYESLAGPTRSRKLATQQRMIA